MDYEEELTIKILEIFVRQDRVSVGDLTSKTEFVSRTAAKVMSSLETNGYISSNVNQLNPEFSSYNFTMGGRRQYELLIDKKNEEERQKEKLKWDLRLAKWQARMFWPLFILALIGGVCGIIAVFK